MVILVLGGSGSGKSAYAEALALALSQGKPKGYLATMEPFGTQAQQRIARHHALRKDKGFVTWEQYRHVETAPVAGCDTVLLECLSTLLANTQFAPGMTPQQAVEEIVDSVETLANRVPNLLVVSHRLGSDGVDYDPQTMDYIAALGQLNQQLAKKVDGVIQVIAGLPRVLQGDVKQLAKEAQRWNS